MDAKLDRYISRPVHLYTMVLPMLLLGAILTVALNGWIWVLVGLLTIAIGIGMGLWIVLAGIWQAHSEHLSEKAYYAGVIASKMVTMARVRDANVWKALGYEMPVEASPVVKERLSTEEKRQPQLSFPTPPATTAQMELLANDVLRGGAMSENRWGGKNKVFSQPKWRELMAWGEHPDRKYWVFINPSFTNLGRIPTRKGTDFLLSYADVEVQNLYKTQHMGREEVAQLFGKQTKKLKETNP